MDKLTELNLPIFSFIIHMMCEKVLNYLQSFFKKISESVVTTLRCELGNSLLIKKTSILVSLAGNGILESTRF